MAETSSPFPSTVGVEDFAFQSPTHPRFAHSTAGHDVSSPAAPPLKESTTLPLHDYDPSSLVFDESSASASATDHEHDFAGASEDEARYLHPGVESSSSRSSISSLPGSVAASAILTRHQEKITTPTSSPLVLGHARTGSGLRRRGEGEAVDRDMAPFRNPSSVRAMQMRDEFEDDDDLTPHRRRHGSRMSVGRLSVFSARSSNSTTTSPTKRGSGLGSRSSQSSPQKSGSKLKKEFPLVLLHCSLLPPTLGLQTKVNDPMLLREVLPDLYWRRWKILEDKITRNGEVRNRGVLIPHPKSDYDMLEERLLESLELERPRIRAGHFLAKEEDGQEDELSDTESIQGMKCPECEKKVDSEVEMERKWEIKVYAANGLMRAGAWGAAWGEMEKVDVEVGVWMPESVRRDVEAKLLELGYGDGEVEDDIVQDYLDETEDERRRREIYGDPESNPADDVYELHNSDNRYGDSEREQMHHQPHQHQQHHRSHHPQAATSVHYQQPASDLWNWGAKVFKILTDDKRNVLIAVLSVLVLFYAMFPVSKPEMFSNTNAQLSVPEVIITTTTVTASVPPLPAPSSTTAAAAAVPLAAAEPPITLASLSSIQPVAVEAAQIRVDTDTTNAAAPPPPPPPPPPPHAKETVEEQEQQQRQERQQQQRDEPNSQTVQNEHHVPASFSDDDLVDQSRPLVE